MSQPNGQQPQQQAPATQPGQAPATTPPQGQPQQQEPLGLLDSAAGGPAPEGGQQQPQGQQPAGEQAPPWVAQLQQTFTSELDRRINQVAGTLRREFGTGGQPQPQPQQQPVIPTLVPGPQPGTWVTAPQPQTPPQPVNYPPQPTFAQPPPQPTGPAEDQVREARSVFREFIGDQMKFLGAEERDLAYAMGQPLLQDKLVAGGKPEDVGKQVADEVATKIKAARKMYETRTIEELRKRNQLKDQPGGGLPVPGGTATPGASNGFAAGQQRAQRMYANRLPQPQHTTT